MSYRKIGFCFLTLFLLALMAGRLLDLQNRLKSTPSGETPPGQSAKTEDRRLFDALIESGLLRPLEDGRLELAQEDHILYLKAQLVQSSGGEIDSGVFRREAALMSALYHSPVGALIRTQVRLWNQSRYLAAVRDDRTAGTGAAANHWRAVETKNPEWAFLRTGRRVPVEFGYVNRGTMAPGFSDWLAAYAEKETVEFRTTIDLSAPVVVQVVGIPEPPYPMGRKPEPCCPPRVRACTASAADTFQFSFPASPGLHSLKLKVRPAGNEEPDVEGLAIRRADNGFLWTTPVGPRAPLSRKPVAVKTADGTALTGGGGEPTAECEALGLLPVTGMGTRTPYALWSILFESGLPAGVSEVRLTIDERFQAAAVESLRENLQRFFPEPENDPFQSARRAAVVLLNANTGAILAAASHPAPPVGVHPWDLAAFAKVYPVANPMVIRGWQGVDAQNAPGSTFKPVVALAGLTAAREDSVIAGFLKGFPASPRRGFERRTGLTLDCVAYDPETDSCVPPGLPDPKHPAKIRNFGEGGRVPLGRAFTKNREGERLLGLKQAVRDSINVWFVRLGMLIDGEKAREYDRSRYRYGDSVPLPEFRLVETAKTLGFDDDKIDLAPNPPGGARLRRLTSGTGDALTAYTGRVDLMLPDLEVARVRVLAQNSIGQSVLATPLQMARTAAAIRTGRRVHPFLIEKWGADEADAPGPVNLSLPGRDELLEGMKAVVEPNGTAGAAFSGFSFPGRLHGKTGTANVPGRRGVDGRPQKTFFTTWFMGVFEPEKGPPLAFACMITHAHGVHRTGGKTGAFVIRDILDRLYSEKKE